VHIEAKTSLRSRSLAALVPRIIITADNRKLCSRRQVRQLVAALKVSSAMRLATRERTPTAAAATLADTVRHSPQRKATFLAEDGAVALIELLTSRKPDVRPPPTQHACSGRPASPVQSSPVQSSPVQSALTLHICTVLISVVIGASLICC